MKRLKEIKCKWFQDYPKTLYSEDIDWLIEQVERYEKVLKEIAEDEKNCEWQCELGYMDYYDGYEKTMKAKEALEEW